MISPICCFVLLALTGYTLSAPLDGSSTGDCPGGMENGAILERGRFFYECRDGVVVPKGCVNDDLKRMEVGGTFDRKRYRLQCKLGSDNLLTYEPVACLFNGAEHKIDEQWEDGNNFYVCKKSDGELNSVNSGCIDQGRRIPLNEKVNKEDFVFVCNQTVNNGAHLMPVACVKEGRSYNEGETFELGKFWYTCVRTGREKLTVKQSGCVNNGKRLNDGDRYNENEAIYECVLGGDVRIVACSQRDDRGEMIERKVGCMWTEGQVPFQYEWRCDIDQSTNTAKKVQIRCAYNVGGGTYNIEPGCYRIMDKAALGCLREGSGLKLQSFQGDNAEQSASSSGLRSC